MARKTKAQLRAMRKDAKICKIWSDGNFSIEWLDEETGERVVGDFQLVGWSWTPPWDRARFDRVINSPPKAMYRSRSNPAGKSQAQWRQAALQEQQRVAKLYPPRR